MKGSLLSGAWCLVPQVQNEATCQRPYAREGKWIRGAKAVNQTPKCSYWVISNPLHDERRVPVFHAPAWSFMVGHERRVPEVCVFFNADKDLRQPLSLLSFVLYLPAEGQTPSPARSTSDAQPSLPPAPTARLQNPERAQCRPSSGVSIS